MSCNRGRGRQHGNFTTPAEGPVTPIAYDLFISYRHLDAASVLALADCLRAVGLRVWLDERRIEDLASIQAVITEGLTHAKTLLAWYSQAYPESRPCQ